MSPWGYTDALPKDYTTQNALDGRAKRVLRPRTLVYATLLTIIFGAGLAGLSAAIALAGRGRGEIVTRAWRDGQRAFVAVDVFFVVAVVDGLVRFCRRRVKSGEN